MKLKLNVLCQFGKLHATSYCKSSLSFMVLVPGVSHHHFCLGSLQKQEGPVFSFQSHLRVKTFF